MASQASSFDHESRTGRSGTAHPAGAVRQAASCRLPPLPNEEIYLYRKPIDNSGVVRQSDPAARGRCWRWVATATAITIVLAAMLWPGAHALLAGYRIESLKATQQLLRAELASLELEEARLLSPEKLDEMAREQQLIDPAPDQVVQLAPAADGSLARNLKSR